MSPSILTIVEGKSEEASVPKLLRRILHERFGLYDIQVPKPFRVKRGRVVKPGELERAVDYAARDRGNVAAVLVIIDADHRCPADKAPQLHGRAQSETGLPVAVVLAKREFEAWFLGCLDAYRGFHGIPEDAVFTGDPEEDDAKGALKKLTRPHGYNTVIDQVKFVEKMDMDRCRERCPSFDKLLRDVELLVARLSDAQEPPSP
jgi:hypothetical protein